jgi:uncharacterized protein YbjT (DUF2867 family)
MILVTGATGLQGGATARHLLARGHDVRALVRNPEVPSAQALVALGAVLVTGTMTDRSSLETAMSGVDGVFSVQPANDDEHRMGLTVAEAASAAGVGHLVYTSVAGVERAQGVARWETKLRIENHIRALGIPATFLRPVMFMSNLTRGLDVHTGQLRELWEPDQPTQVIAVQDIGWFAAQAFADPATYEGHAWEIAGDELSHKQMAAAISAAICRTITYVSNSVEALAAMHDVTVEGVRRAMAFVTEGGWKADIASLRVMHPGLMDFDTWLEHEGAARFEALLA